MLLGKADVILNVAPTHVTYTLVRKVNVDRYDDREVIKTNLIESYKQLLEFGRKNLPDKFFLKDTVNKSLRNTIAREKVSNTLMYREFTSSYTAKFVIEKNPIIAAFFRNIGYADQLGSGVRNLFKYSKFYSGKEPEFVEGDVFRMVVPLDEAYSYDFGQDNVGKIETKEFRFATKNDESETMETQTATKEAIIETKKELTKEEIQILRLIEEDPFVKQKTLHEKTGISLGTIKRILPRLQGKDVLVREGGKRFGKWIIKEIKQE